MIFLFVRIFKEIKTIRKVLFFSFLSFGGWIISTFTRLNTGGAETILKSFTYSSLLVIKEVFKLSICNLYQRGLSNQTNHINLGKEI